MQYVGFWRRFAAAFIDNIALFVVSYVILQPIVNLVLSPLSTTVQSSDPSKIDAYQVASYAGNAFWLTQIASLAITILYWVVFQGKYGQTLGKKALGIKVVDANGKTPSMMTFFLREIIGKFVSGIILLIGYLMVIWDGKKQGLHDKIAGTFVVRVGSTQSSSAQTTEPAKA